MTVFVYVNTTAKAALPFFDNDCSPHHEQRPVAVSYFGRDIGVAGRQLSSFQARRRPLHGSVTCCTIGRK